MNIYLSIRAEKDKLSFRIFQEDFTFLFFSIALIQTEE